MADRIEALVGQMTLEEKCFFVAGKNMWETLDIERLGIRSLKFTDGPAGVRGATWIDGTHTTYVPCGISLGATFDGPLVERIGNILGAECLSKRSHVLLAPTMNISRSPLGGRNFENFGEDPFLTGVLATHYIRGVQAKSKDGTGPGVGACMKHFVANDMETRRFNMDQQIDERTLREIYLKPFQLVMERGGDPWTAMTAYPKINGEHADCSTFLIEDILRNEWGFKGLMMSDWGGLNDTVDSIVAGTDVEMPGPPIRYGSALLAAVHEGKVSEAKHLDAAARNILYVLDRAGLLDPETEVDATSKKEKNSDLPEFRQTARDAAAGAIVLLKNTENAVLPLDASKIKTLAIIGPNAKTPTTGGTGSAAVNPYYITNPLDSITEAAKKTNPAINIVYEQGIRTNMQPTLPGAMLQTPPDAATGAQKTGVQVDFYAGHEFAGPVVASSQWANSVMFMMSDGDTPDSLRGKDHCYRVRGVLTPTVSGDYQFSLSNTGQTKLYLDDALFIDNTGWTTPGGTFMNCGSVNKLATRALVAGQAYSLRVDNIVVPPPLKPHDNTLFHTLSGVRVGVQLQIDEEALFARAVEAAKTADAVVLVVGHNNDTEKEGTDRTSLLLPRRTNELVSAVCAVANPAATAVVTQSASAIAMPWAGDAPAIVHAWFQGQENGNALADVLLGAVTPSGKLPITFPHTLEDHGSHKWFPGDAVNDKATYGEGVLVGYRYFDAKADAVAPLWPFGYGLSYTTFAVTDIAVAGVLRDGSSTAVTATVTNTGARAGAEVVQVYVSPSAVIARQGKETAPRSLAGFAKVFVEAGASKTVRVDLDSSCVAWYDVDQANATSGKKGAWRVDAGTYTCFVGTSSREFVKEVELVVE